MWTQAFKTYLSRVAWFAFEKDYYSMVPSTFYPSVVAPEVASLKPGASLEQNSKFIEVDDKMIS